MNAKNMVKEKSNQMSTKINFSRISFLKLCVKETVVVGAFIFEHNIFQIFGPKNDILFCPFFVLQSGISSVICSVMLYFLKEGIKISFRQYGAILFQYLW